MANEILFFLAADDEAAAATRPRGPGAAFESVSCPFVDPDTAIAEWDMDRQPLQLELLTVHCAGRPPL